MSIANIETESFPPAAFPTAAGVLVEARVDRERYLPYKRALDVMVCLVALPLLLLLMGVVALCVVLDSKGSPFFVQERVGKDGQRFRLYKFRTMRADYDGQADREYMQSFVAGQTGERPDGQDAINKPIRTDDITRVGRFLRKASLDEVPQVFNVLKGEMSLIGPRPNVPWETDAYLEWHRERLAVMPGITGLAQVHGRSSLSFNEIAAYDVEYVRTLSLRADLAIMLGTARIVITRKGAL